MPKKKILRSGRIIKVKGGGEVYTRLSKQEYETRRDIFDDPDSYENPIHLQNYAYDDWVMWGAEGGRPRKWNSDAERMRFKRVQIKLEQGLPLTAEEKQLLDLTVKRTGAYKYHANRPSTSQERVKAYRERIKNSKFTTN